jgi:LuxR family transcriptional regulator, maltose regulon positive regulatory protein
VNHTPHAAKIKDAASAERALRQGVALALQNLSSGRAELQDAATRFAALGDDQGSLLSAAALVLFIGIADDDYDGFEAAVEQVISLTASVARGASTDLITHPADKLLVQAGAVVAGSFVALDAPGLAVQAATLAQALARPETPAPVRCCAGLAALNFHRITMDLPTVMWLELAMRPLLADPAVSASLVGEASHLFVQSLYECEAPPQAVAMRERWRASVAAGRSTWPVIELKFLLLDAQMALGVGGAGQAEVGRAALARAEPLLNPRAPRPAGWWHLLTSRLNLMQGQHRSALTHARLALRLMTESHVPKRWMGLIVMQEGQVQMAVGAYAEAVPFFERAAREASGSQADFCHCMAQLAQALQHLAVAESASDLSPGLIHLASGLKLARALAWLSFFRPSPHVAAAICAAALEHGIEATFAREVIQQRGLPVARPDLVEWPWPIRVRSLGALRIELNGQALNFKGKVAKKPLELLMFVVASSGSDVSVATAAFALWRELDGDKARAALNIALHRLRKLLGSDDGVLLAHGRLSLNPQTVWVDCLAFEQLADSVGLPTQPLLALPLRAAAQRAVALYTGPFLGDSEDEAWQMVYRSRLASKFKRMLTLLARDAIARGDHASARAVLERGLECDPLAEDLVRMREQISAQTKLGG